MWLTIHIGLKQARPDLVVAVVVERVVTLVTTVASYRQARAAEQRGATAAAAEAA